MPRADSPWPHSRPPEQIRPFQAGVTTVGLDGRPPGCLCTWVPEFTRQGTPPGPGTGRWPAGAVFRVTGFRLKFASRDCPARGHYR